MDFRQLIAAQMRQPGVGHLEINESDLLARMAALPLGRRHLIAVAGPPGAGKSTFAQRAACWLDANRPGCAAVLEMDGFHLDDSLLKQLGRHERKGAPDTFDAAGLAHMLRRLRCAAGADVTIPVFDRHIEVARSGAGIITGSTELVIVEGNYLLVDRQPWRRLQKSFDIKVLIKQSEKVLRKRLIDRWTSFGLDRDEIVRKLELNDLPNGRFVMEHSVQPDFVLTQ